MAVIIVDVRTVRPITVPINLGHEILSTDEQSRPLVQVGSPVTGPHQFRSSPVPEQSFLGWTSVLSLLGLTGDTLLRVECFLCPPQPRQAPNPDLYFDQV